jgi:hypothetical protein
MIVWGGSDRFNWFYMGGRYNPLTDAWRPTSIGAIPGRGGHTAVWSGSDMIIWGGYDGSYLGTGARYNLGNVWAPTSTTGAPFAREGHTAVWTGNEMIVWGGGNANGSLISGGRYRPYREVN